MLAKFVCQDFTHVLPLTLADCDGRFHQSCVHMLKVDTNPKKDKIPALIKDR